MKRILSVSPAVFCVLYVFFPLCRSVGAFSGYDFVLRDLSVFIVGLTVISVAACVLLLFLKLPLSKVQTVFCALLPLFAAVNGLFLILDSRWKATGLFALICYACSVILLVKFTRRSVWKIGSVVLSVLLAAVLLFSSLISFIFGDLGQKTVVKSAASPRNTYLAEVIDDNQGALGGDTHVDVWTVGKTVDLFLCKFSKSPVCVYTGKWGEFGTMRLSWRDEHTLVINGTNYDVRG